MVAANPTRVEVTDIEVTPTAAGVAVTISQSFPLTDLDIFVSVRTPQRVRVLVDSNEDGTKDMVVETPLKFVDADGDGVITRDSGDRLVLEPDRCEVIQHGVPLDFGAAERSEAVGRIIDQLGGQRRSFPVSVLDPRGVR